MTRPSVYLGVGSVPLEAEHAYSRAALFNNVSLMCNWKFSSSHSKKKVRRNGKFAFVMYLFNLVFLKYCYNMKVI